MTPADAGLVALQLLAAAVTGWAAGDLLMSFAGFRRKDSESDVPFGGPELALTAIVGFVAFSIALMVLHIATSGALFGTRLAVPAIAIALIAWRRGAFRRLPTRPSGLAIAVGAVLVAVYVTPVVLGGPAARTGDSPWHLGWSEQLLHGEPVPTGPAPEVGRNAYPWGFHALIATSVRLVPGSDPLLTHDTLDLVVLAGVPLAAACIARRFRRSAGSPAALAVGLIGGFGWMTSDPQFVTIPSEASRGADLVVASPNSVYELLPPAFPREIALVLFGALVLALLVCVGAGDRRKFAAAGVLAGLVGLINVPMFITSMLVGAVAIFFVPVGARRGFAMRFFGGALALFALWATPVLVNYFRYEGFVDITPQLGVEWPLPSALGSWGLLLPLGLGGAAALATRHDQEARAALAFVGAVAIFLAIAVARSRFGWTLGGNATLFHQGRVWPAAHLLGGALAGVGIATIAARVAGRRLTAIGVATVALLGLGAISPVIASLDLRATMAAHEDGFIYGSPDFDPDSFIRRAAAGLDPIDVVDAAAGSESGAIPFLLFQFSGARIATHNDPRLAQNDLRIRFGELATEWDARRASGGFPATHRVVPRPADVVLPRGAIDGSYRGAQWALVEVGE